MACGQFDGSIKEKHRAQKRATREERGKGPVPLPKPSISTGTAVKPEPGRVRCGQCSQSEGLKELHNASAVPSSPLPEFMRSVGPLKPGGEIHQSAEAKFNVHVDVLPPRCLYTK